MQKVDALAEGQRPLHCSRVGGSESE